MATAPKWGVCYQSKLTKFGKYVTTKCNDECDAWHAIKQHNKVPRERKKLNKQTKMRGNAKRKNERKEHRWQRMTSMK